METDEQLATSPITSEAPYACTVCGGGVKVLARDVPSCADPTGGYAHFSCLTSREH